LRHWVFCLLICIKQNGSQTTKTRHFLNLGFLWSCNTSNLLVITDIDWIGSFENKNNPTELLIVYRLIVHITTSKLSQVASSIVLQYMYTHHSWMSHYLNHIIFMQCFWSSLCCWHVHIDVLRNPDLWHLQQCVWHCFRQALEIISRQLSAIGLKDIRRGCKAESEFFLHPIYTGEGSLGVAQWAFIHVMVW